MKEKNIKISVIITVYNGEKTIKKCLLSLLNQSFNKDNYEIIVVNDGSTDNTEKIVKKIIQNTGQIIYFSQKNSGSSKARNIGVNFSKYDNLAFTDADAYVKEDWLEQISNNFLDKTIKIFGGKIDNYNNNFFSNINHIVEFSEFYSKKKKKVKTIPSVNFMIRKNIFIDIGGFDEELICSYDSDINYKFISKGYDIFYEPSIIVYHDTTDEYINFLTKEYIFGLIMYFSRLNRPKNNFGIIFNKGFFVFLFPFFVIANTLLFFGRRCFYKHPIKSILGIPFIILHRIYYWLGVGIFLYKYKDKGFSQKNILGFK